MTKKMIVGLMVIAAMLFSVLPARPARAATIRKCYTIPGSNTTVYTSSNLSTKKGTIYPTDELTVENVTSSYCIVTYPLSSGGTKTGYIATSKILLGTSGNSYTSSGKITAYRRNSTANTYGSVSKGDTVTVLGTSGSYTQIKYPVSGGYKYAFIKTSDAQTYLYGNSGSSSSTSFTSFSQKDTRWCNIRYGYSNKAGTTIAYLKESGCGVLALTNAVYYLKGTFIEPSTIASFSLNKGYRVNGVGTSLGLYEAFCNNYGTTYGIKYVGSTSSISKMKSYLQSGNVAIMSVPNHLLAVVAYDSGTGKFLVLDSYPSSNRGTSSGYRWMSASEFTGSMAVNNGIRIIGKR